MSVYHGGHSRAQRLFPVLGPCEGDGCGERATDRHHRDGNQDNNDPSNVRYLCRRCHMLEDGRLARLVARNREPVVRMSPPCRVCTRVAPPLRQGRCHRCDTYVRRTGREWNPATFGQPGRPRSTKEFCKTRERLPAPRP